MLAELILIAELLERSSGVSPTAQQPIPKTFAESLRVLAYPEGWDADKIVVNLTPEAIAIYQESERVKRALRGL
jgi:hypothetical protein